MESKCSCYVTIKATDYFKEKYVCYGTKECEECSCGGDKSKCDFYDYIRKQADQEKLSTKINDSIKFLENNGYVVHKVNSIS